MDINATLYLMRDYKIRLSEDINKANKLYDKINNVIKSRKELISRWK